MGEQFLGSLDCRISSLGVQTRISEKDIAEQIEKLRKFEKKQDGSFGSIIGLAVM